VYPLFRTLFFCGNIYFITCITSRYIDNKGQLAIQTQFDEAESFYEGMAWVKLGEEELSRYDRRFYVVRL
jgi:hypothetical protein